MSYREFVNGEPTWAHLVMQNLTRTWQTTAEIAEDCGGEVGTIGNVMNRLHGLGLVEKSKQKNRRLWRVALAKKKVTPGRRRRPRQFPSPPKEMKVHPIPGTEGPCCICGAPSASITLKNGIALELCLPHYEAVQPFITAAGYPVPPSVEKTLSELQRRVSRLEQGITIGVRPVDDDDDDDHHPEDYRYSDW
jgi:hypothetical protein